MIICKSVLTFLNTPGSKESDDPNYLTALTLPRQFYRHVIIFRSVLTLPNTSISIKVEAPNHTVVLILLDNTGHQWAETPTHLIAWIPRTLLCYTSEHIKGNWSVL